MANKTITSVEIEGSVVTLNLDSELASGDVTIDYVAPNQRPVSNPIGYRANDFRQLNNLDKVAPIFQSATVNGANLVLVYDESLSTTDIPAVASFAVRIAGRSVTVSAVVISGRNVTLTLSTPADYLQTVTVSYTQPTDDRLQDTSGNFAASISNQSVTNTTPDTTAPILRTAAVNGTDLRLTYNENMLTTSVPAVTTFDVEVGGVDVNVSSVTIVGREVRLNLASNVGHATSVTIAYAVPDTNSLKDANGIEAPAIAERAVTNNTPDTTAPRLVTAAVNGTSLLLEYNENLDARSVPARTSFDVEVNDVEVSTLAVAITANRVRLILARNVLNGTTVTVSYTVPAASPIQDTAGNDAVALTDQSVTNSTPDTFTPMATRYTIDGDSLVIQYNEAMDSNSVPAVGQFNVRVNGTRVNVSSVAISGANVTLTMASSVIHSSVVLLSYTVPTNNPIQDTSGNDAAAITNQAVTNLTDDDIPPVFSGATVNLSTLRLVYNETLDTGSVPAASAFTVTIAGTEVDVDSVAIAANIITLTLGTAADYQEVVRVSYAVPNTNPIQDIPGNDAVAFSNQAATNTTPDTTAPILQTATINLRTVVLTYNENLRTTPLPAATAFSVDINDTATTIRTVVISGDTITLTTIAAADYLDTVTVTYTAPTRNPVQDVNGNNIANLVDQAVTNNTPDTTAPTVTGATADTATLVISFDEELSTTHVPATSTFEVDSGGVDVAVSSLTIAGRTVTLTLGSNIEHEAVVTVTYDAPSMNPLQDPRGNLVADFSNQTVTNNTPDTTAPSLSTASASGSSLILVFDEILHSSRIPGNGRFNVQVNGARNNVTAVAISGVNVTLTLTTALLNTDTVTISYNRPTNVNRRLQDRVGNHVANFSGVSVTVADIILPALSSAVVNTASLVLTYNEALDTTSTPAVAAFAVKVTGTEVTISSVAVAGRAVTLTLAASVGHATTVTVSYAVPNMNPIQDEAGNAAASLADHAVTNNTPDTTKPSLTTATVNGTVMILTYNEALDTNSVPAVAAFAATVGGTAATISSITITGTTVRLNMAANVGHGSTVRLTYTIPNTNRIQDTAGNDANAFSNQAVTNNTPDTTVPVLSTATVDETELVLTYSENLDTTSVPATSAFTVTEGTTEKAVSTVAIAGAKVTLTVAEVEEETTVVLEYTVPMSNPIQDLAGNKAAALTDEAVTNNTVGTTLIPTGWRQDRESTTNFLLFRIDFERELGSTVPPTSAFDINDPGFIGGLDLLTFFTPSISVSGMTLTIRLQFTLSVTNRTTATYRRPTNNFLTDDDGNAIPSFTALPMGGYPES